MSLRAVAELAGCGLAATGCLLLAAAWLALRDRRERRRRRRSPRRGR